MTAATFRSRVGLVAHSGIDHACLMLYLGSTVIENIMVTYNYYSVGEHLYM